MVDVMAEKTSVPKFAVKNYREIDEIVAYMEESAAREKLSPEPGCPNDADEITDEAFEAAAFFLAEPFNAAVERIHAH
jgi:hypothetical protein